MNRLTSLFAFALLAFVTTGAGAARPAAGAKSAAPADSDAVLIRVGRDAITRRSVAARLAEIPEQYRATYQTADGRRELLQRLVEEKVWTQDAEAHGIPQRAEVLRQLAQQRRDLLIRTRVTEVLAGNPAPSDSDARVYYDAHQADFRTPGTVTLRHIQLRTESEARKVLALARAKGANWNNLATQWSADSTTRNSGGNLGTVTKDGSFAALGPQPALAESAFALGQGGTGGPYKSSKGWHVLRVDAQQAEGVRPLDQVRSFIIRQLTQQRQQTYYQDQLDKAKARYKVVADSSAILPFLSARKTAREMFQDAQQAGGAQQRIDAYRAVIAAYPDADISPQAQFMVGFIESEELKNYDAADQSFHELLAKYPKSELAASAQWMVDHMRTEDAPDFLHTQADSLAGSNPAVKVKK